MIAFNIEFIYSIVKALCLLAFLLLYVLSFAITGVFCFPSFSNNVALHAQYYVFFHHLFPSKNSTTKQLINNMTLYILLTCDNEMEALCFTLHWSLPLHLIPTHIGGGAVSEVVFIYHLINCKQYCWWWYQKVIQSYNCLLLHWSLCNGEVFF